MKTGAAISGLGHAALIAVILLGLPWFPRREHPPIPVTEVSFVSEADFSRAQAAARAPRQEEAPPEQPRARPATREAPPVPDPAAAPEAAPSQAAPEVPAAEPEVTTLAPSFDPDAPLAAPNEAPAISALPAPAELSAVAPPRARIAPSLAPAPTRPEPAAPSEEPVPAPSREAAPEPVPEEPERPEPAATPEPPATQVLETAVRPLTRRGNMEAVAARPDPAPTPPAPAEPVPSQTARPSDLVRQLREEVAREQTRRTGATPTTEPTPPTPPSEGTSAATSLPSGPPITNSERNGLVLAVQRCWNLPAGLRDAGELKVTLAAGLNPDGSIVSGSVRLIEPNPAPDPRFQQAYEAGRRALLRCAPYSDLPREKYAQWREIEVVFNPEGMVSW